jgi:hypothetical protein
VRLRLLKCSVNDRQAAEQNFLFVIKAVQLPFVLSGTRRVGKANVFRMWLGRKTVNCQMKRRHFGPENRYDARIALSSRRPKLSFYMYAMFYVFDEERPQPKHICSFLLFQCACTTALRLIDLAPSFVDMARILNHTKTRTPSQQIQDEMGGEGSFTHSFLRDVPNKNIIRQCQSHGHIPIESRSM